MILRLAALVAVLALLSSACSSGGNAPSDPGATGQDFFDATDVIAVFTSEWNAANLNWMVAYTDNSVSIDEYLRISYETEQQQRNLLATFSLAAKRFPQSMQDSIDDLEENYRNRANAFHDLIAAEAARTDNVAWQAAFDEYGSHSFEEANLAIIEGLLATPEIAAAFAEGVEYDDFVEALRLAFGTG
jgi:hypothetical protein